GGPPGRGDREHRQDHPTTTALVTRARELRSLGHPDADRHWARIAELLDAAETDGDIALDPALGPVARLRADVAEYRTHDALDKEDWVRAREQLAAVADLFDQAGQHGHALAVRARALVVDLDEEKGHPADRPALDELLAAAEALPAGALEPDDHLLILQCRAFAAHHELVAALSGPEDEESGPEHTEEDGPERTDEDGEPQGPPAELVERFTTLVAAYRAAGEAHGSVRRTATARQFTADLAARQGRLDEAEAELHEILGLLEDGDLPWHAPRSLGLLGQVLFHKGQLPEAAEVFHRAIAEATRWADDDFPYGATYMLLGHVSALTGETGAAVRSLSEAAARFDRDGKTAEAAETRLQLGNVLRGTGRAADAVAVLESVLGDPAVPAAVDERMLAQIRLDLARGLSELEEYRDAAEEFLRLADSVAGWEDQDTHTMAAAEATVALAAAGHWDAVDAARERALASHTRAPRPDQVSAMLREIARLTVEAQGPDGLPAALERLAEADALRERAEEQGLPHTGWYLRGAAHYERAKVYIRVDRPEEALASVELAITAYEVGGEEAERPRAEATRIAAMIEGNALGRPGAARARLAAAIERCRAADLPDAVEILSSLHDHLAQPHTRD
ncbi:hypothetical protein ACWEQL_05115, partial [Kitasatospora sp. NPDC004240]